ncbi:hypothetical protein Hanom_Chr14g01259551 [Helianthus anomalus]
MIKEHENRIKYLEEDRKNLESLLAVLVNDNVKVDDVEKKLKENDAQIKQLKTENMHLVTLLTSVTAENERLHLVVKELETEKAENAKKFDMLFKVLHRRYGIDFATEHDEIEIEEAQARAAECKRIAQAEAAKAVADGKGKEKVDVPLIEYTAPKVESAPVTLTLSTEVVTEEEPLVNFVLIGGPVDVPLEVIDRKKMYAKVDEEIDAYVKDDDEEKDKDVDGKSDKKVDDKKDDDDSQREEGEFVHNYTKEEIAEILGIDERSFEFDFENELNNISATQPNDYLYKYVPEADDYDRVVVDDDSDEDDNAKYSGKGTDDFLMYSKLYIYFYRYFLHFLVALELFLLNFTRNWFIFKV